MRKSITINVIIIHFRWLWLFFPSYFIGLLLGIVLGGAHSSTIMNPLQHYSHYLYGGLHTIPTIWSSFSPFWICVWTFLCKSCHCYFVFQNSHSTSWSWRPVLLLGQTWNDLQHVLTNNWGKSRHVTLPHPNLQLYNIMNWDPTSSRLLDMNTRNP